MTWLDAWSDVLRLCDATGISSIEEFDDRFPLSQSLFNWSQDLEMALENAGRDDGEIRQALIDFCEESFRRFPREDQLLTENRRRTLGGAYFDAGMTEKAEELFRSWLDADPAWGWGWIGWADCYLPWAAGRRTWPGPRNYSAAAITFPVSGTEFHRGAAAGGVRGHRPARRSQAVWRAGRTTAARAAPRGRQAVPPPGTRPRPGHRAKGQGGAQCPVPLRQREEVQEMLRFPRRGEVEVTEESTAFANARIFDGTSAELRDGCVRVAAGTIAEVAEGPEPGDRIIDCHDRTAVASAPTLCGIEPCYPSSI